MSIEEDLYNAFIPLKPTFMMHSVELGKLDHSGHHPKNLGDFDLIIASEERKIIILFECKVLSKCGFYFETNRQQKQFFEEHKEDIKFQRRIDYVQNNMKKVLKSLGINSQEEFELHAYMVTNKNFVSLYKDLDFEIVLYDEVIQIVSNMFK